MATIGTFKKTGSEYVGEIVTLSICEIVSLLADRIAHGSHTGAPYQPQVATESI